MVGKLTLISIGAPNIERDNGHFAQNESDKREGCGVPPTAWRK